MFLQVGPCRWIPIASVDDVRESDGGVEVRRSNGERLRVAGDEAERVLQQVTGRIRPPKGAEKSAKGGSAPVTTPAVTDETPATEPAGEETPADDPEPPKAKRSRKKKSDTDEADAPAAE